MLPHEEFLSHRAARHRTTHQSEATSSCVPWWSAQPLDRFGQRARDLLDNWAAARAKFVKVFPTEYQRALGGNL